MTDDPRAVSMAVDDMLRRRGGHAAPSEPTPHDPDSFPMDVEGQAALIAAQEELVADALQAAARRRGLSDPKAVPKLADWSQLEFDETGQPTNTAQVLDQLVSKYPALAPSGSTVVDQVIRNKAGR